MPNHGDFGGDSGKSKVVLFADDSKQSVEARRLLREAAIPFREIPSSGSSIPTVKIEGADSSYPTLDGVRLVVRGLTHSG